MQKTISHSQRFSVSGYSEPPYPCGMSRAHILWVWLLRSVEVASLEPDEHSLRLPVMLKGGHTPAIPFSTDAY